MMEVNSIEEFVAGGESDLKALADAGNSVAAEWLAKVQVESFAPAKLYYFGEIKIALMRDTRPDAKAVMDVMFPAEQGKPADCKHENFEAKVEVNRLEDIGRFTADVRIRCVDCGTPFGFLGLATGLDLDGATVSVDGTEAHLALLPTGRPFPAIKGVTGFRAGKWTADDDSAVPQSL